MTVPEFFGCKVFDDRQMRARLSAKVYASLKETIDNGKKLDLSLYSLVPAHDGHHGGKARRIHQSGSQWGRDHGVFRERADPG